jgi:hypothetical protein
MNVKNKYIFCLAAHHLLLRVGAAQVSDTTEAL